MSDQTREMQVTAARLARLDMYSQWLTDDVDGITHNLAAPGPFSTATLADARERVALALSRLDQAIARDAAAHREMEPA